MQWKQFWRSWNIGARSQVIQTSIWIVTLMICIGRCQKCYIFTLYITDRLWCSARGDDACVLGEGVEGSDSAFVPFLLKIQETQNLIFKVSYIYALHMNCDTDSVLQDCLTGGDRGGDSFSGRTWDLIWPESSKSFGRAKDEMWNILPWYRQCQDIKVKEGFTHQKWDKKG